MLAALAAHVLEAGLNTASLRPMAAAAGTSDRMLIYHFGSKDGLIRQLLGYLATDMANGLDSLMPPVPFESEAVLTRQIVDLMRSSRFQPYTRVWLDIISAAAQGSLAHREAGQAVVELFLNWIAQRHPKGRDGAATTFTLIEGAVVMDAVGRSDVVNSVLERLSLREEALAGRGGSPC